MKSHTAEEQPPDPSDLAGWRAAVNDGRFRSFPREAVVAAVQELGPNADREVVRELVLYVSDEIMNVLRRHIGTNHPNKGKDIIDEAHGRLIEAVFTPGSKDGRGLREAFVPRIRFRAADALRADSEMRKRGFPVENIGDVWDAKHFDDTRQKSQMEEKLYVEQVLSRIADERKRLAFRLHMEGVPLDSTRTDSIAKILDVSGKTAGLWIEEVRAQLIHVVGEQS